jgi:LEA14-like dessication related protein
MTGIYHNIRNEAFETNLTKGENKTRFSLRFVDKTLNIADKTINNNEITAYLKNSNTVIVSNNIINVLVKEVSLFNTIGQSIISWKIENQEQHNIQLPIKKISAGVYIAKIQTTEGNFSKKIIIP